AVLLSHDGCDWRDRVAGGDRDDHAGGQHQDRGGADQPDCDGGWAALCDPRGWQDRRRRCRGKDTEVTYVDSCRRVAPLLFAGLCLRKPAEKLRAAHEKTVPGAPELWSD